MLTGFIPYGKLIANFWAFDLSIADAQKRNPSDDNRHTGVIRPGDMYLLEEVLTQR